MYLDGLLADSALALLRASVMPPRLDLLCCMSDCLSDKLSDCDPGTLLAATPHAMQHGGPPTLRPGPVLIFPSSRTAGVAWQMFLFLSLPILLPPAACSLLSALCTSRRNGTGAALTSHFAPTRAATHRNNNNKQQRAFDGARRVRFQG